MNHSDRVIETVNSPHSAVYDSISASWNRSYKKHGLDPSRQPEQFVVTETELISRTEAAERLLQVTSPKMDHLFQLVGSSGCGVFLTDQDGVVIDQRCRDADLNTFTEWGLLQGANWSEEYEGTNGVGTCLVEDRKVIIHRDQHFFPKNIGMSCIDAPIYGANGETIGVIDVSSARLDQTDNLNALISKVTAETALQIEVAHFMDVFSGYRIVLVGGSGAEQNMLLAINSDDVVVGATRAARKYLQWNLQGPLQPVAATDLFSRDDSLKGFDKGEKTAIIKALTRTNGNVSETAKALGIGRATLYRRMKRLGLERSISRELSR